MGLYKGLGNEWGGGILIYASILKKPLRKIFVYEYESDSLARKVAYKTMSPSLDQSRDCYQSTDFCGNFLYQVCAVIILAYYN